MTGEDRMTAEQQAAIFAEVEAARRGIWEVPLAWGLLIAIATLGTTSSSRWSG